MRKANISVIVAHIGSWLLFLSLPVIFITSQANNTAAADVLLSPYYWLFFIFFVSLFYLHTYTLFPLLYRRGKKPFYVLSVAALFVLVLWLKPFDKLMSNWFQRMPQQTVANEQSTRLQPPPDNNFSNQHPPPHNFNDDRQPPPKPFDNRLAQPPLRNGPRQRRQENKVDIISIFMFIVIIAISISFDVSKQLRITAEQAAKAEADKANAELLVLKTQVNPHFLFNTLNNIYSLAVTGNENTAESILKLSNIMRYTTDDAPEDYVPLQKEVDCITDFIDLQRLRMGSKVMLDYSVTGNTPARSIAPFILLTFVENAFKYGISNQVSSHLVIQLTVTEEGIAFFCSNPLPETKETDRKGTGIANVKKRLAFLYPGRYMLNIFTNNNLYTVQLSIRDKK